MKLVDYCREYVDDLQNGRRCRHRRAVAVAVGTVKAYKTLTRALERFESETGVSHDLDEVGMNFQKQFVDWCMNQKRMSSGTVRNYMTMIRVVMNVALRERQCSSLEFRRREFVPLAKMNDMLVLTPEKMERLMTYRFRDGRLREARDLFVAGYLTGQRFSDYSRISKEMYAEFDGRQFVRIVQRKTGEVVYVPLDIRVDGILKHYNGRLPQMSLSEFNLRLREVAEVMGWGGGLKLTSHTARRSFATNAYAAGIPIASIMCITGHTREEHLKRYLRLSAGTLAVQAARDLLGQ